MGPRQKKLQRNKNESMQTDEEDTKDKIHSPDKKRQTEEKMARGN